MIVFGNFLIIFLQKYYQNGLNINDKKIWFDNLILMFQKEVADRIIAEFNTSNYGRLSILAKMEIKIKKIV